jgi:hypothetical protein
MARIAVRGLTKTFQAIRGETVDAIRGLGFDVADSPLAILIGAALGLGMATNEPVRDFFDPLVALIYPLPKTAWARRSAPSSGGS